MLFNLLSFTFPNIFYLFFAFIILELKLKFFMGIFSEFVFLIFGYYLPLQLIKVLLLNFGGWF